MQSAIRSLIEGLAVRRRLAFAEWLLLSQATPEDRVCAARRTVYSLLQPTKRDEAAMNVLGFFTSLFDDCELYALARAAGITKVQELARCRDMAAYQDLARAGFNLVLHPESRLAAQWMAEHLGIPSVELARVYQPEKIHR